MTSGADASVTGSTPGLLDRYVPPTPWVSLLEKLPPSLTGGPSLATVDKLSAPERSALQHASAYRLASLEAFKCQMQAMHMKIDMACAQYESARIQAVVYGTVLAPAALPNEATKA